jgi:hypothetical protein
MKFPIALLALTLAACSGRSPEPAPEASTLPAAVTPDPAAAIPLTGPAAGKWRQTAAFAGEAMPPHEICFDKQMSLADAQAMQQQAGITCSEQTFTPAGNGFQGHSVCRSGEATITSDTVVTGDFNTAYTMEITSTRDPAPRTAANPSVTKVTMERLGDCTP